MATPSSSEAPVVLFGYDSSPFTTKVRLALKLKQIPHTFVVVTSMMPRPILKDGLGVTYRKIPVLAIGRDVYIDTSLILEELERRFPPSKGYGTIYPPPSDALRPIIRGFASFWTDRPLFRFTTGVIPSVVWRTHFGTDRANLIGHKLDPNKLEQKIPINQSGLDLHLSVLEPVFADSSREWIFGGEQPSAADLVLWYQLDWGDKISRGQGIADLTGGATHDTDASDKQSLIDGERYPQLTAWFERVKLLFERLPSVETRVEREDEAGAQRVLARLKDCPLAEEIPLIHTPAGPHSKLNQRTGLVLGAEVSIAPDDTGRDSPSVGTLLAVTPEEVVIAPKKETAGQGPAVGEVRIHFPRIGFVARPLDQARL